MDFGFGFPWGTDRTVFETTGWRQMLRKIGKLYVEHETARNTAEFINAGENFDGHGPFRFDHSRNDFRFYKQYGVGYYRLTELIAPQAISQCYLGSGGTVGFHTITGLAAIDWLIGLREKGELDFEVWPHETLRPSGERHLLVESYPAICPKLASYGPCKDGHQRDAWRVLAYLSLANDEGRLSEMFEIKEMPFGRIDDVYFFEQIRFEGFIIGLH